MKRALCAPLCRNAVTAACGFLFTCLINACLANDAMLAAEVGQPEAAHTSAEAATDKVQRPISFRNDIVPILTKSGCNGGVCHAKAGGGQNGFQLSLLGFEPDEDYRHIVLEGRSRRLFPIDPSRSLLLQKAAGEMPHGGGVRLPKGSPNYQTLLKWIEAGTPFETAGERKFVSMSLHPEHATLSKGESIRFNAIAHFDDGSQQEVTANALFESNQPARLSVDESGQVTAEGIPGRGSVMVRYLGQTAVFPVVIPTGETNLTHPPPVNFIDELVFANLSQIGLPASPLCDDAEFLRRVTLDIGGRIPTREETQAFLEDSATDKRSRWIESMLNSPSYADYFANKWTALLKNRRDAKSDIKANFAFHAWIRDSLLANTPYDELVSQLLAASGTIIANPPVAWYKRVTEPKEQIEDVAQLFLGVRMQCAQCHHHPFERWSQDDYYALTAFFSRVGRKPTDTRGEDMIFHERGVAQSTHMKTLQPVKPRALGDSVGEIPPDEDPRLRLAQWMRNPENPFFAKALVNRYWKHFFHVGLIEPEDDIRDSNPASNPDLLSALEQHFVEHAFDLKELIRVICNSATYQISAEPLPGNLADDQNFSRFYPKRMQAEVLLDSIDQVTGATTSFANLPIGTRAVALPDNSYNQASPFLRVFGRPEATSVCECERVASGSLAQSLHLMNASDIKQKLSASGGRAATLAKAKVTSAEKITEIYQAALSRPPNAAELATSVEFLDAEQPDEAELRRRLEDIIWALLNTKEFLFNH